MGFSLETHGSNARLDVFELSVFEEESRINNMNIVPGSGAKFVAWVALYGNRRQCAPVLSSW